MLDAFIARLLMFPKIAGLYYDQLKRINFGDDLIKDITTAVLESYDRFSTVKVEYLKEKFADRTDIDLFMKKVSDTTAKITDDEKYATYWIGKFLCNLVIDTIDNRTDDINDLRRKILLADELRLLYEGRAFNKVHVWDFVEEATKRLEYDDLFKYRLKTGISLLDEQVNIVDETVTIFMAPFKRYKSIILTNMGCVAMAQKLSVFHVHYEGKQALWESRYDSCMTGILKDRLYNKMEEGERERFLKIYSKIRANGTELYFMKATPKKTGLIDIENRLDLLRREGKEFQVIIIDYLNLMKPSISSKTDDWLSQGEVAWDLVNLCQMGYIVISAIQTRGKALDKKDIKAGDYGRSIVIPQAIDNLIAVNQTDAEKPASILRMEPLALRDGFTKSDDTAIKMEMKLSKMRISQEVNEYLDSWWRE